MEMRLAESQRMQAAGDQQLQQLAQQCGQLTAERDQLARLLDESRSGVAEKEARVEQLMRQLQEYRSVAASTRRLQAAAERGAVILRRLLGCWQREYYCDRVSSDEYQRRAT